MIAGCKWTEEDELRARGMFQNGATDAEIGRDIMRSASAVRIWRHKNGLVQLTKHRNRWKEEDLQILSEMVANGKSDESIAVRLNRTAWAIYYKRRELELKRPPRKSLNPSTKWYSSISANPDKKTACFCKKAGRDFSGAFI